jgi:hypothetical protein
MLDPITSLYFRSQQPLSRRAWLRAAGLGFGSVGLASLLAGESLAQETAKTASPLASRSPHFTPRAKRVIFLFMHGGPSSVDTFDPKERLTRDHGKPLPIKRPLAFDRSEAGPLMKSPWTFRPGGKSGLPVSDLFPFVRDRADDLCVVRSMVGEGVDHGAALLQTFTGRAPSSDRALDPGLFMDSELRTRTFPDSSPSSRHSRTEGQRTGARRFFPVHIRERPSVMPDSRLMK